MADKEGRKTGGRTKGTPNKRTVSGKSVEEICRKAGVDPFVGMCRIVKNLDPVSGEPYSRQEIVGKGENAEVVTIEGYDPELRASMLKELGSYIAPKRKAIEHTGANGTPLEPPSINVTLVGAPPVRPAPLPPAQAQPPTSVTLVGTSAATKQLGS